MEHRGAEGTRGCRSREFRVSQVYPLRQRWGTMRAVPFSALPFFIKPWKYYTAYPCHSSRLFVSTINHSRVSRISLPHSFSAQIHGRSANVSFVFFRVFFLSCHYYKNNFFSRGSWGFYRLFSSRVGYFHWKNCAPSPILFRFNIFFSFFSSPYIFWNLRIPSKRICYIAISFARILYNAGKTTRLGWIMYLLFFTSLFSVFVSFFLPFHFKFLLTRWTFPNLDTRNLILSLSLLLLTTSGEKNQFRDLINFLLPNESITRRAIL